MHDPGRRNALKLFSGGFVLASFPWELASAATPGAAQAIDDGTLGLLFDGAMRTRVIWRGQPLTAFDASESLLLKGDRVPSFTYAKHVPSMVDDPRHGKGARHVITGTSKDGIEKSVDVTFFQQFPGLAVLQVHYRNTGANPLDVTGWRNAAHELADAPGGFWSFSGATHEDRRDWIQPVKTEIGRASCRERV